MDPPKPEDPAAARQRNYQAVIDTCKDWCKARGVAPWAHLYRLVFAVLSESGGLVYGNDGLAFADNAEQVRPGWAEGVPLEQRARIRAALAPSMSLPHDAVGNNGGSTGILQQLSQDYVGARFPGKTWGWGPLAGTMDVTVACGLFLERLVVSTNRTYQGMDFDPIAADVLRVQQPLLSEASSGNYGPARVAAAKHIVDNWGPTYFVGEPASDEPRIMAVGGARTSRGIVWLDDLPGASPAEKLRAAWTPGSQDRRCIIAPHGTVLDVGSNPIPRPAGTCLAGPASAQTEFSDQGRVHARGSSALFRSVDSGTNYAGTKGWSDINIGWEGQPHLRYLAANPMDASGPIVAYASIEGCSFDTFLTVIESPMLGVHLDVRYFNNCYGPYMWKLTGSDCQLWTHGGKGDWGGGNTDPKRRALLWLAGLEKSTIGSARPLEDTGGGLYITCSGAAGVEIEGGASRGGVDIFGLTVEGRNAGAPSSGAALRQTGNSVNYFGGNVNFAMGDAAAGGHGDRASADISGGVATFFGTRFRRGSSTAPFIARRGSAVVDTFGCREVPSNALVSAVNL